MRLQLYCQPSVCHVPEGPDGTSTPSHDPRLVTLTQGTSQVLQLMSSSTLLAMEGGGGWPLRGGFLQAAASTASGSKKQEREVLPGHGTVPTEGTLALTGREVPLGIVEAVRVGWPLEGVPWGEVVLHEAGREAVEVVGVRRLVELRMLLVGREGPSEVRRPLHAEGWLTLAPAPGRLLVLAVPGALKLAVPVGVGLAVPGCVTLAIPAGVPTLLAPHALVAVVPGGTVGRPTLMVRVGRLLGRLQGKEWT